MTICKPASQRAMRVICASHQKFCNLKKKCNSYYGAQLKLVFTHCLSVFPRSIDRSIVGAILFLKSSNSRQSLLFECFSLESGSRYRSSESPYGHHAVDLLSLFLIVYNPWTIQGVMSCPKARTFCSHGSHVWLAGSLARTLAKLIP